MKYFGLQAFLFVLCAAALADLAAGDEAIPSAGKDDTAAIRAAGEAFVKAFNAHDAQAVAAHFTADGDYMDEEGQRYHGREAIEKEYAAFFAAAPKVQIALAVDSIRLVSDNTAVEDGRATLSPMPAGTPGHSRYTAVHVKQDGQWLMASVRDTHVELPSQFARLADLDWLAGDWTAESHGRDVAVATAWIANKNYLKREFTVREGQHVVFSATEIIGFDPLTERISSWTFDSNGGHSVGQWSPHESGWLVETTGTTADGTLTSAVNELASIDQNGMSWRSVNRKKGDVSLPDLEEVVLKRK